jgi:hypothetical protein
MVATSDTGYFRIELQASEESEYPALTDISYFLHDFNLLYEFSRIIVDPKYRDHNFSRFSAYRNRHRIDADDQLGIETLSHKSPLLVIAVIGAVAAGAGALWAVTQAFEKIANFRVNRDIMIMNREKLRRELEESAISAPQVLNFPFRERLREREAAYFYEKVERHLEQNSIQITRISVSYVRALPPKDKEKK